MKIESRDVCQAFLDRKPRKMKRSHTDGAALYLFGNKIAWHTQDGGIAFTMAGHPTVTTRDRLNTLCLLWNNTRPFYQKRRVQYYNDTEIHEHQVIVITLITLVDPSDVFEFA